MADLFTYAIYLGTLLVSVWFAYLAYNSKSGRENSKRSLFFGGLSLVVLTLISGLRYNVGADYIGYEFLFDEQPYLDESIGMTMELGYTNLVNYLNMLGLGAWSFFTISAFLTYILFFHSFKYYKPLLYLGIFFFITYGFYFFSFNGVRQAIAVSALAAGMVYIREKKLIPFLILIVLGGLIHKSLFLFAPLYFVLNRIKLSQLAWFIAFSVGIALHFLPAASLLDVTAISLMLEGTYMDYSHILTDRIIDYYEESRLSLGYLARLAIGFYILSYYPVLVKLNKTYLPYFTMSLIGIVIYNAFSHNLLIGRLNIYFLFFTVFSLAFILKYLLKTKQNLQATAVMAFFVLLFCYSIYVGESEVVPYQFIQF